MTIYSDPHFAREVEARRCPELIAAIREDCTAEIMCFNCQVPLQIQGHMRPTTEYDDFEPGPFFTPHEKWQCPTCEAEDFGYTAVIAAGKRVEC